MRKRMRLAGGMAALSVGVALATPFFLDSEFWRNLIVDGDESPSTVSAPISAAPVSEPIPVNGSKPMVAPVSLTISGEISGLAPGAVVSKATVYSAGRAFAATVQGHRYTATINALRNSDMVEVVVESPGVRYRSVVGSFLKLKMHSGGDRQVVQAELASLYVSPWNTAAGWMVSHILGRDAANDAEFEQALRSIPGEDVMQAAYVLDALGTGQLALPPGFADGLAVLDDESTYHAMVTDAQVAEADVSGWFVQQPVYSPLDSKLELPSRLALLSALPPEDVALFVDAFILERGASGVYSLHDPELRHEPTVPPDPRQSVALTAFGELVLTPYQPDRVESWESRPFNDGSPVRVVNVVQQFSLRRLTDGRRHNLWALATQWLETYPDRPQQPPRLWYQVEVLAGMDLDAAAEPITWPNESRSRALPWICRKPLPFGSAATLRVCAYARHSFSSDGEGLVVESGDKVDADMRPVPVVNNGPSFQWSVDAGNRLRISQPDVSVTYWNIDSDQEAGERLVYLARTAQGETTAGLTMAIALDVPLFDTSLATGSWESGFSVSEPRRYPDPDARFYIERWSDGFGQQRAIGYDYDGGYSYDEITPHSWEVVDGKSYDTRWRATYPDGTSKSVADCAGALAEGAVSCDPYRVRYFRPLRRIGQRLYGIEEYYYALQIDPAGPVEVVQLGSRANFHECISGECIASGASASSPRSEPADWRPAVVRGRRVDDSPISGSQPATHRLRVTGWESAKVPRSCQPGVLALGGAGKCLSPGSESGHARDSQRSAKRMVERGHAFARRRNFKASAHHNVTHGAQGDSVPRQGLLARTVSGVPAAPRRYAAPLLVGQRLDPVSLY